MLPSLQASFSALLFQPHRFLTSKPFALIFALYTGTYLTANSLDTFKSTTQNKPAAHTTSGPAKFVATSAANLSLCLYKDSQFTKIFGAVSPRPIPPVTYALFAARDCLTIFASFNLPPMIAPSLPLSAEMERYVSRASTAQFLAPAAIQLISTPFHLLGLDMYNRNGNTTMKERFAKVKVDWLTSSFARMCRNMFVVLAIVACAIIVPVNVIKSVEFQKNFDGDMSSKAIFLMTPRDLFGQVFWAFVVLAYVIDIIVCGFLWWMYRAVHRLRRQYLEHPDYQNSLYARTLMITDVGRSFRSDQGIVEITDSLKTTPEVPRASVGRNVKDIPDLIEAHEEAVIELEKILAKYLKNPNKLPAERPLCTPSKKDPEYTDRTQKVDAIEYLTARIQRLEIQIKEVRETIDKRDALSYGFASYETIDS